MGIAPVGDLQIVEKKGQLHSIGIAQTNVNVRTGEVEAGAVGVPVDPAWLAATLSTLADTHQVPGAQLAVHRGGVTVAVEVGEVEHGVETPVTEDTAFPIGSISKAWTATLAMILVADGDLGLDAPLDEHLPELDHLVGRLTLRQLLSHTSGFADIPELCTLSPGRYVREHCRRQDLVLAPETAFSYSSRNYVLAGHLIETITGMDWWEAMESILLRPLGIEPATIMEAQRAPYARPIATGHSVNTTLGRIRPVQQSMAPAEAPAGALALSAVDLVALGLMHIGPGVPNLLPAADAEQMRQAVPGADPFGLADGWGCGLAVFGDGTTDWVGHDGNANGTSCYLRIDPAGGWVVALTTNGSTGTGLWQELGSRLRQAGIPLGEHRGDISTPAPIAFPAECVGSYSNGPTEWLITAAADGDLCLASRGELVARLVFSHDMSFVVQDPESGQKLHVGRFLRDPITKEIELLQIFGRIARRRPSAVPEPRWPAESLRRASA